MKFEESDKTVEMSETSSMLTGLASWLEQSLTPHSTQYRSFRRRSSQPITWLILTNKTVQENTDKQTQYKSEKVDNLKYSKTQEAQLSPKDRAMRRVNWNLANCHATVQKLLIRQVLTKSMAWSWRFSWRQCVIDNVHSTMTRPSRLPLSQAS